MKQSKLALTAVMVVAIGLTGANFVGGSLESTEDISVAKYGTVDSSPIYGHVTIVHSDPEGNILSYIQTDNAVTNQGKDCAVEHIFSAAGGLASNNCVAATANDNFDVIGLTNGQSFPFDANATSLNGVELTLNGLAAIAGTVTGNAAAVGTDYTASTSGAIVDIAHTFTATADAQGVDGAILYNAAKDAVFAAKEFTPVTLNNLDTLAVTWTITLG